MKPLSVNNKSHLTYICLLIIALIGAYALFFSTSYGIGLKIDTAKYFMVAQNLRQGIGLYSNSSDNGLIPYTSEPPIYPALITVLSFMDNDILHVSRGINILIFAANIFLVGFIVQKYTRSFWASILGALLFLSCKDILIVHAAAMTDAPFLFTLLCSFIFLDAYIGSPTIPALLTASMMVALSCLIRFSGISLVLAAACTIFLWSDQNLRLRTVNCIIFTFISLIPTILWVLWGFHFNHQIGEKDIVFHPINPHQLSMAATVMEKWFMNRKVPPLLSKIFFFGWAAVIAVTLNNSIEREKNNRTIYIAFLFSLCYMLLLIMTMLFFIADIHLEDVRFLSPIYASVLIISICLIHDFLHSSKVLKLLKVGIVLSLMMSGISYMTCAWPWIIKAHADGLDYNSKMWRGSPLIQKIKLMPTTQIIYTNTRQVTYLLTGRVIKIYEFPSKILPKTMQINPQYPSEMKEMQERTWNEKALIIYFNKIHPNKYAPLEGELKEYLSLLPLYHCDDGTIYEYRHP